MLYTLNSAESINYNTDSLVLTLPSNQYTTASGSLMVRMPNDLDKINYKYW